MSKECEQLLNDWINGNRAKVLSWFQSRVYPLDAVCMALEMEKYMNLDQMRDFHRALENAK